MRASNGRLSETVGGFLDLLRLHDPGLTKVRLGSEHDGGYVVLGEICQKARTVYSFGVGDNAEFELDFVGRFPQAAVRLFDPTIKAPPEDHPRFEFQRRGVGMDWPPLCNLGKESLLKLDVEWDEWGSFSLIADDDLRRVDQIVAEFHILHAEPTEGLTPYFRGIWQRAMNDVNVGLFAMYRDVMARLTRHFWIFHMHANNSLPVAKVGGYGFPPLIEVSMVRKDLVVVAPSTEALPVEGLDSPNKTDRPDIIGWYPFGGPERE